jgi:hypothetical protein
MHKYFFLIPFLILAPAVASAATLSLSAEPPTVGVGNEVSVTVRVDAGVAVNTFAGALTYPPDVLSLVSVNDGSSIASVWLTHPFESTKGTISFIGITPGGFSGRGGKLFSIVFRTQKAGSARLSITHAQVLLNDGKGTSDTVQLQPLSLSVVQKAAGGFEQPKDTDPPEPFVIFSNRDQMLSGDKNYFVFAAVDKQSGIDHYEGAETRLPLWLAGPQWKRVESPYISTDQYGTSDILIKAVDVSGNARIAVFHRTHFIRVYEWIIGAILIVLLAAARPLFRA